MSRFPFSRRRGLLLALTVAGVVALPGTAFANPAAWKSEWPRTDFSKASVDLDEIFSGGPPKDGIPAIDNPRFRPASEVTDIGPGEPVIRLALHGDTRAYPLRILIWHEIVNDTVGGVPVTVTYCPLCNSSIVFDRRLGGETLDFGTTGKLRNSDLVMYDRQTESWWQQFTGTGIVGRMTGQKLAMLPSRVMSYAAFKASAPDGEVLVPPAPGLRPYGQNPYRGYDTSSRPFLYRGGMPEGIEPLAYVLAVGKEAWSLDLIRARKRIESGDLVITWAPGQNSALDEGVIAKGRDIGNVTVQRQTAGGLVDAVHDLTFAFTFHAFVDGGVIHKE